MKIIVLETGTAPDNLSQTYGTYGAMFQKLLADRINPLTTEVVQLHLGDALPAVGMADGYLVTGSPAGVYEPHDWIAPLEVFTRNALEAAKPVVGICFGHQLMAQALGGKVAKSDKGWGVGLHQYDVFEAVPDMPRSVSCVVSHQDQVIVPPTSASTLGGSSFCEHGILAYGEYGLSFQMHPEFEHDFAEALLSVRQDRIPLDIADIARTSFDKTTDRHLLSDWIARFLREKSKVATL